MKIQSTLPLALLVFALIGCTPDAPEASPNAPTPEAKSELSRSAPTPPQATNAASPAANAAAPRLVTIYSEDADRPAPDVRVEGQGRVLDVGAARTAGAPATSLEIRYEAEGAPAGTDALALRLRAHHASDVPTGEELQAIEGAAAMLLAIEADAQVMVERQRALTLLRHFYDDADARARLLARASEDEAFVSVRVEALRSLAAAAPAHDDEAQAVLAAAASSENARVRSAVER